MNGFRCEAIESHVPSEGTWELEPKGRSCFRRREGSGLVLNKSRPCKLREEDSSPRSADKLLWRFPAPVSKVCRSWRWTLRIMSERAKFVNVSCQRSLLLLTKACLFQQRRPARSSVGQQQRPSPEWNGSVPERGGSEPRSQHPGGVLAPDKQKLGLVPASETTPGRAGMRDSRVGRSEGGPGRSSGGFAGTSDAVRGRPLRGPPERSHRTSGQRRPRRPGPQPTGPRRVAKAASLLGAWSVTDPSSLPSPAPTHAPLPAPADSAPLRGTSRRRRARSPTLPPLPPIARRCTHRAGARLSPPRTGGPCC